MESLNLKFGFGLTILSIANNVGWVAKQRPEAKMIQAAKDVSWECDYYREKLQGCARTSIYGRYPRRVFGFWGTSWQVLLARGGSAGQVFGGDLGCYWGFLLLVHGHPCQVIVL